ncbi:hypothetical protein ACXIHB_06105 [Tenacibaculum sp. IMCC1]|uniref:Uncharacterized protein n=1 Tax=Tenacibaculum sp. Pbs-1 TaxID=3238748 RepID=A0AB33KXF4_9FLAO
MYPSSTKNETNGFTGEIIITDLEGNFLKGYRANSGNLITKFTKKVLSVNKSGKGGVCPDHGKCTANSLCLYCTQELDEVVVSGNTSGGSAPVDYILDFSGTGPDDGSSGDPNTSMGWDYGDGGGGTSSNTAEDQIINNLTGKAKCVYEKLLSSGISNYHNMITDLFIEFGDNNIGGRDLTFKMSSELPENRAGEIKIYDGNYYILINENLNTKYSSIEIAGIIVHEIAHAFLAKHYNNSNASFSDLYQKYINNTGIQNYSHDIMRDQFINRMATVLKNYDSSIFSSFDDYKILASYAVFDLTDSQKQHLINVKNKARQNDNNCN